jgi:hypothetical protein
MFRTLVLVLAVLALALYAGAPAVMAEEKTDTHEGTFVKADDKSLTMKGKDDKEHSHDLTKDTKVTIDGKDAKVTDIKAGTKIKVTVNETNKVTKIELVFAVE